MKMFEDPFEPGPFQQKRERDPSGEHHVDAFDIALRSLDQELAGIGLKEPLRIQAIGGYALLKHGIRDSDTAFTVDIDSVSDEFSPEVKDAIRRVGEEHDLDAEWLNTQVVSPEETAETVEASIHAEWIESDEAYGSISMAIADVPTLTRTKISAVDDMHVSGRSKDWTDLHNLLLHQGITTLAEFDKRYPEAMEYEPGGREGAAQMLGARISRPAISSHEPDLLDLDDQDFADVDRYMGLDDGYGW